MPRMIHKPNERSGGVGGHQLVSSAAAPSFLKLWAVIKEHHGGREKAKLAAGICGKGVSTLEGDSGASKALGVVTARRVLDEYRRIKTESVSAKLRPAGGENG